MPEQFINPQNTHNLKNNCYYIWYKIILKQVQITGLPTKEETVKSNREYKEADSINFIQSSLKSYPLCVTLNNNVNTNQKFLHFFTEYVLLF